LNDAYSVINNTVDANNAALLPATASGTPNHFGINGPLPGTPGSIPPFSRPAVRQEPAPRRKSRRTSAWTGPSPA